MDQASYVSDSVRCLDSDDPNSDLVRSGPGSQVFDPTLLVGFCLPSLDMVGPGSGLPVGSGSSLPVGPDSSLPAGS